MTTGHGIEHIKHDKSGKCHGGIAFAHGTIVLHLLVIDIEGACQKKKKEKKGGKKW